MDSKEGTMSEQSKGTIATMAVGAALAVAYIVWALSRPPGWSGDRGGLNAWALAILVFIGIGIVAAILVQIAARIAIVIGAAVRDRAAGAAGVDQAAAEAAAEDEMDKLIALTSGRVGFAVVGIGFLAALAILAGGASAVAGLHTLLGAFALGALVEGGVSVHLYERGVRHG
jgi:hypothetical protein